MKEPLRYKNKIVWDDAMLRYIQANFSTMANADLAKRLHVGARTVVRKARELGLVKDETFSVAIGLGRRISRGQRKSTNKNWRRTQFKKGEHRHLENEFKPGHQLTPEQSAKKSATSKLTWHKYHTPESIERARVKRLDTIYRDRVRMKCGLRRITKMNLKPNMI